MVIVAGMSRGWPNSQDRLLWTDDEPPRPAVSFSATVRDPAFTTAADREKQHSRAERIRLLYVATTRAESRLAVSGHGYALNTSGKPKAGLWGTLLGSVIEDADAPDLVEYGKNLLEAAAGPAVDVPDEAEWSERSREISARSAERAGWSATRIVHPDATGVSGDTGDDAPEDAAREPRPLPEQLAAALRDRFGPTPTRPDELPPAPRGTPLASGPDVGTAVHYLAEHTDLSQLLGPSADPVSAVEDWERWAADQLIALGLGGGLRGSRNPEAVAEMVAVARTALTSEPVRRAATRSHWAELPVAGPLSTADGTTVAVDGVVDLVVEEADGSVSIIDYKTDVAVTTDTVDEYLLQLCAYAELLHGSTGRSVSRIELVFCRGARPTMVARDLG